MGHRLLVILLVVLEVNSNSATAWAQAWMTGRTSFYITRALIGACEGGFVPGTILFTTYFYKSKELSVRLATFWSSLNVSSRSRRIPRVTTLTSALGCQSHLFSVSSRNSQYAWCRRKDRLVLVVFVGRHSYILDWFCRMLSRNLSSRKTILNSHRVISIFPTPQRVPRGFCGASPGTLNGKRSS